jgi:hypothetical protein
MSPDEHTLADAAGRWSMDVVIQAGENVLRFRIGDDRATELELRLIGTA